MKKYLLLCIVFIFIGCNLFESNPFKGKWVFQDSQRISDRTMISVETFTFYDNSLSFVGYIYYGGEVSKYKGIGRYEYDKNTIKLDLTYTKKIDPDMPTNLTLRSDYKINNDRLEMTVFNDVKVYKKLR